MSAPDFGYSDAVASRFPQARAAVITVAGLRNNQAPPDLDVSYRAAQSEVLASFAELAPAERPSIKAWRAVFSAFGVKPTQHRNAAEALLRRLQRHGDIPSISPAVDLGNLVSIRHSLPVAVFDLDSIAAPLTVTLAGGSESFIGIGSDDKQHPTAGEVVFIDAEGTVCARRWCWKQSAAGATQPATKTILYVIEAVHCDAADAVSAAADDLEATIEQNYPSAITRRSVVLAQNGDATGDGDDP